MFVPDSKDSAEIIHDIVELHLQVFQDVAGLHTQLKYRCEKCLNDNDNKYTHSLENKITHIFPSHGFKHLLQLNPQLLDVVNQYAGLRTQKKICSLNHTTAAFHIVFDLTNGFRDF